MLLITELIKLRHHLLNTSSLSLKEKAFYQFLVDDPLTYPTENDLTEIEQICLAAFSDNLSSKKELIAAQRKKGPIHGMHYSKNLIELSAMAIENLELERSNLELYCEKCSTRDFYILNKLFSNIPSNPLQPRDAIDQIALHLYRNNFPQEGWKPLLLTALYETSDLTDFYIIEQGYQQAMNNSPIVHQVNDILYLRDTLAQVVKKTERRVKFALGTTSVFFLAAICYWLLPLIMKTWDKAEPIMAGTQLLVSLIISSFIFVAGFIPDRIKLLNLLRENIINWVFRRKGFNRLELKETLNRLADQDEV